MGNIFRRIFDEIYYWPWRIIKGFRERTNRLRSRCFTRYTVGQLLRQKECYIRIGKNLLLDPGVEIVVDKGSSLVIGSGVQMRSGSRIRVTDKGSLIIGDNVYFARNDNISCWHKIVINDEAIFASYVSLHDHQHKFDLKSPVDHAYCDQYEPIIIGKGVWCGVRVSVLNGVTIGNYSVIGANSVVTKSIPEGCVAGGVPARILRQFGG